MKHTINTPNSEFPMKNKKGEAQIKAEAITNAWLNYCMQSRIFRILRYFGLR